MSDMRPKRLSRDTLYTSDWLDLHRDRVELPSGTILEQYHVLDFPRECVAAVVENADGDILLIRIHRYPGDREHWEIPAGRIEDDDDILGAAALGIRNCLCLSGDHQSFGAAGKLKGHPGSKNVFDIDSIQLVSVLRDLRDESRQQGGDEITAKPDLFIGAAWSPLGDPVDFRVIRLAKKIAAGAQFIQTQSIFDIPGFTAQMKLARNEGLHEKAYIMPGIIVPKSAGMLRYMNKNVAGVTVSDELIDRMDKAKDRKEEGLKVTVELIDQVRQIEGVSGVHIQAIEAEGLIPEITKRASLLPRPNAKGQD